MSDALTYHGEDAHIPAQFPLPAPPDSELVSTEFSMVMGQPAVRLEFKSRATSGDLISLYEQYFVDWGVAPERQVVSLGVADQLKLTGNAGDELRRVKVIAQPSEPTRVILWWRSPNAPTSP